MFSSIMFLLISVILFIFTPETCISEVLPPTSLYLYSPGALDYTDVIVKRVGDNLTLACEMRGDTPSLYVWNYAPANASYTDSRPYTIESNVSGSWLRRYELVESDGGRYVCSAPPHSQAKQLVVQPHGGRLCAMGALWCGKRCVLPSNICDGRADCVRGEDEAPALCGELPCARSDRLNCSSGRCIPSAACCAAPHALCRQHACCDEHPRHAGGYDTMEVLPPFEDRHAPDDYGFIQSTIYTVTACALIFMIAVVLLVSAICKMHIKRAALRSYTHANRPLHAHYAQPPHRYPPCYEAAALLQRSPQHAQHAQEEAGGGSPRLTTLAAVFGSRYSQVPTQCPEVEMLPAAAAPAAPAGAAPDRQRLTLQLGRFHLSIPSFRREPRPDTPTVAEINIDDLDFVRLNANDTYTLNGRTIHLLNGHFDSIPGLGSNPPPYNEAMRYKTYGPPPEYLSRDRLNRSSSVDEQARSNIEMPPGYEELGANGNIPTVIQVGTLDEATNDIASNFRYACGDSLANNNGYALCNTPLGFVTILNDDGYSPSDNGNGTPSRCIATLANGTAISIIGNALSTNGNASTSNSNASTNGNASSTNGNASSTNGNATTTIVNATTTNGNATTTNGNATTTNGNAPTANGNISPTMSIAACPYDNDLPTNCNSSVAGNASTSRYETHDNGNNETLDSVIDNLPAIDSDVNANDDVIAYDVVA